jgi:predicted nucleotidyltransferase component of viral defense system
MDEFISLSKPEQNTWLTQAADIKRVSPIIIEKDFWVCWILKEIFSISEIKNHIVFKGGTSLSKIYKIIDRFSEDVDLTISKEYLGVDPNVIYNTPNRKQREKLLEKLAQDIEQKINNELLPILKRQLALSLAKTTVSNSNWSLEIDPENTQHILFSYPRMLDDSNDDKGYINPVIRLEFGIKGDVWPSHQDM